MFNYSNYVCTCVIMLLNASLNRVRAKILQFKFTLSLVIAWRNLKIFDRSQSIIIKAVKQPKK